MCWNRKGLSLTCEGKWAVPGPPQTSEPLALDQTLRLLRLWGNFSWWECKMAQCRGRAIWQFLSGFFQTWLRSGLHTAALLEVAQDWKPSSPLRRWPSKPCAVEYCAVLGREEATCIPVSEASQIRHWGQFALWYLWMEWKMRVLINLCKETM